MSDKYYGMTEGEAKAEDYILADVTAEYDTDDGDVVGVTIGSLEIREPVVMPDRIVVNGHEYILES